MLDKVTLIAGTREISDFESYSIESDLYKAADAFTFTIRGTEDIRIDPGMEFRLKVGDSVVMNGVIDKIRDGGDRRGVSSTIEGRDLMGVLVDHCVESFQDINDLTLATLAERLIRNVPFIKRKNIRFETARSSLDRVYNYGNIEPGATVFDVLNTAAAGRGLLFYCSEDGTFYFGKPAERPDTTHPLQFNLIRRMRDPSGNNIIDGWRVRDISEAYSKAVVVSQQQGTDSLGAPIDVNLKGSASLVVLPEFPYYKPYVKSSNKDNISPTREAKRLLEQFRSKTMTLQYTVDGHIQNGKPWAVNKFVHVDDEAIRTNGRGLVGDYLIYSRTFTLNKQSQNTALVLGLPGMVQGD